MHAIHRAAGGTVETWGHVTQSMVQRVQVRWVVVALGRQVVRTKQQTWHGVAAGSICA
jgi:hypothetical protein